MSRPMTDAAATSPLSRAESMTPALAVALTDVTRAFADRRVLGPVTLRLDAGVLAVVRGVNGAGKTTLLRIAAGLLAPTSGTRSCSGRAVYLRPGAGGRHPLRVGQVLAQTAALTDADAGTVTHAVAAAGLEQLTGRRVAELSAGEHARLSVVLAVASSPALACLDEPTAHLDARGVDQVRTVVRQLLAAGTTVLMVSHSPEQFADLADAALHLADGLLRADRW